jgi:hypothetical protein
MNADPTVVLANTETIGHLKGWTIFNHLQHEGFSHARRHVAKTLGDPIKTLPPGADFHRILIRAYPHHTASSGPIKLLLSRRGVVINPVCLNVVAFGTETVVNLVIENAP